MNHSASLKLTSHVKCTTITTYSMQTKLYYSFDFSHFQHPFLPLHAISSDEILTNSIECVKCI